MTQKIKINWVKILLGLFLVLAVGFLYVVRKHPNPPQTVELHSSKRPKNHIVKVTGDPNIDQTLQLIKIGGPFPYPDKDGSIFYNREGRLPTKPKGFYREYTVPTPDLSHRGPRRIVTGGDPPTIYYLTLDHYRSFEQLEIPQ